METWSLIRKMYNGGDHGPTAKWSVVTVMEKTA